MKTKIYTGIQILAGLMLIMFGMNKFLHFIPMPPPPAELGAYLGALMATGYLMTLVAIIEIGAGISFLLNKYTALMAVILMPVMVNAFLAHLFLDISGIGGSLMLTVFTIVVMIRHKEAYTGMFKS
ncbi:MAG: DoxX family membrane protein [Sulfurovum sp.]|nr:DoxX family membrane protein [Sulfurovum sp.]